MTPTRMKVGRPNHNSVSLYDPENPTLPMVTMTHVNPPGGGQHDLRDPSGQVWQWSGRGYWIRKP